MKGIRGACRRAYWFLKTAREGDVFYCVNNRSDNYARRFVYLPTSNLFEVKFRLENGTDQYFSYSYLHGAAFRKDVNLTDQQRNTIALERWKRI